MAEPVNKSVLHGSLSTLILVNFYQSSTVWSGQEVFATVTFTLLADTQCVFVLDEFLVVTVTVLVTAVHCKYAAVAYCILRLHHVMWSVCL